MHEILYIIFPPYIQNALSCWFNLLVGLYWDKAMHSGWEQDGRQF